MSAAVESAVLIRQLNWRYAVKKFDATKKISPTDWSTLEEALVLAPSSFGLQPFKFIVVQDPAVRAKLRDAAYGQSQVTDASHMVVLAYNKSLAEADVDRYMARIAEVRKTTVDTLAGFKQAIMGSVNKPKEQSAVWASRQVYIALGVFLQTASLLGVDACPMEGFAPEKFDEILGLDQRGLASVAMVTAGYRAADDGYQHAPKVRARAQDIIIRV